MPVTMMMIGSVDIGVSFLLPDKYTRMRDGLTQGKNMLSCERNDDSAKYDAAVYALQLRMGQTHSG